MTIAEARRGMPDLVGSGLQPRVTGSGLLPELTGSGPQPELTESDLQPALTESSLQPDLTASGPQLPEPAPDQQEEVVPFEFTGAAAEYFRISIVNLLLMLVTCGLYSPWAKIRRLRYFYGNTLLAGRAFGYHASPVALLKGRLLALGVLAALAVTVRLFPSAAAAGPLAVFAATPWLVVRGMRFRLRNTTHRGLRFGFDGRVGPACVPYLVDVMLAWLTLGLRTPRAVWARWKYLADGSRLGATAFSLEVTVSPFRRAVWGAAGVALASVFMALRGLAAGQAFLRLFSGRTAIAAASVTPFVVLFIAAGAAYVYFNTAVTNAVWNNLRLGPHRFVSSLEFVPMLRLQGMNLLAIVATAGLAIPWARIRLARYRTQHLQVIACGRIGGLRNQDDVDEEAFGSETADALDIMVGL
jgi:uncharacterized membrane protein YjgN (DUF898 family)